MDKNLLSMATKQLWGIQITYNVGEFSGAFSSSNKLVLKKLYYSEKEAEQNKEVAQNLWIANRKKDEEENPTKYLGRLFEEIVTTSILDFELEVEPPLPCGHPVVAVGGIGLTHWCEFCEYEGKIEQLKAKYGA